MDLQPSLRPSRPQTISQLVAQAENFTFIPNIPFKSWARASENVHQEGYFSASEGNYATAYIMFYRHSILVLKFLPTHPQFKDPESRNIYKPLSKRIGQVLHKLEELKPEIENEYKEWERMQPITSAENRITDNLVPSTYADFAARDPSLSGNATILDASENQDLAVDLAQQELSRRDSARREQGFSSAKSHAQDRAKRTADVDNFDLRKQMEAARRTLDQAEERRHEDPSPSERHPGYQASAYQYSYPSVSRSQPVTYQTSQASTPALRPNRPPKELKAPASEYSYNLTQPTRISTPPQIPNKSHLDGFGDTYSQPPLPPKGSFEAPMIPKKERVAFKPGAYLENGDPIRSVFLPNKLRKTFLEIAAKNTQAGLEMCGILCGTPVNNALFVRCLLIPDQKCTSDTCETENESAVFDYCIGEDLLVIGWIHTHPTQTCFMSSRDLHTHSGYQVMMPESIAIVCAPKFTPSYGIFRLTHPPGLDHVLNCTRSETFHQHSIDNIYREAEHPHGHVYESDKMPLKVHDLRSK